MKAPNGKPANLTERQWLQVRTKAFKKWFGDWEKSIIFANDLINKYNGKENAERLSLQRMDLAISSKIDEKFREATSIFEGGSNSSSQSNEGKSRETNAQKQSRLEQWAKENNLWIDNLDAVLNENFGSPFEGGGEAVVYYAGKNVVKSISLDYYDDNPQLALDRILLHNYLFPDTQLTDIGFGMDTDGTFNMLVSQLYIKGTAADRDEILQYAEDRGFNTTDGNAYYFKGIKINDLNELNVIKDSNGILRVIDAQIGFLTQEEIDSHNAHVSKVVDENGEPMVVYHGTNADFTVFNKEYSGQNTDGNASDEDYAKTAHIGHWFNSNEQNVSFYSRTMNTYISLKNPLEFTSLESLADEMGYYETADDFIEVLKTDGYDGIIINDEELGGISYCVLHPNQIKSATENVGTFDEGNNDIRFSTWGKKKSVPETASVQEEHQPTVVSSTDGAKILNNLDNLIIEYEKKETFLGDIAKAIGAQRESLRASSKRRQPHSNGWR